LSRAGRVDRPHRRAVGCPEDGDRHRDDWRRERARERRWHHRDGYYRSSYDRGYNQGYYGY